MSDSTKGIERRTDNGLINFKSRAEDLLRGFPPLFRLASRVYHSINGSFRTLSPGAPEAISKSFQYLLDNRMSLDGDYYEFGLFRGYTFLHTYMTVKKLGLDGIRFNGFDSFKGLPQAEGIDQTDGRFFKGQFACSLEAVQKNLKENGMDLNDVVLIKGFYEDSLTTELHQQHSFRRASVLLLDCDYYSSTKTSLDWMDSYIEAGTIILFDDWFSFGESNELGQQKAFQEFLHAHPEFSAEELWEFKDHGKAFILKSTQAAS